MCGEFCHVLYCQVACLSLCETYGCWVSKEGVGQHVCCFVVPISSKKIYMFIRAS